ncbi:hypothetical protein RRG08_038571 [Elysia crispata]|uniref:Uncharacterized protein n=1 Tax=Elysia crispata TaxID=231223 RepID=A0AAE0YHI3_9GAST|nr:hypothetical protein RRG08_038571 [Elysia crispata]
MGYFPWFPLDDPEFRPLSFYQPHPPPPPPMPELGVGLRSEATVQRSMRLEWNVRVWKRKLLNSEKKKLLPINDILAKTKADGNKSRCCPAMSVKHLVGVKYWTDLERPRPGVACGVQSRPSMASDTNYLLGR